MVSLTLHKSAAASELGIGNIMGIYIIADRAAVIDVAAVRARLEALIVNRLAVRILDTRTGQTRVARLGIRRLAGTLGGQIVAFACKCIIAASFLRCCRTSTRVDLAAKGCAGGRPGAVVLVACT